MAAEEASHLFSTKVDTGNTVPNMKDSDTLRP